MRWFLTVLGLVGATVSLGANRYVAPNGADGNPCTQSQPCRSVQRGIDVSRNGDTVILADGVYSTNLTDVTGCSHSHNTLAAIRNKDCPNGCTLRAANVDSDNPRVTLSGGELGLHIESSDGWTVEGIYFDAPAGVQACRSADLTLRDSVVHFQQEPARTYYGMRLKFMTRASFERMRIHEKTKFCWVNSRGPDSSNHRGMMITDSTDLFFQDFYLGFTDTLGNLTNVQNAHFNRVRFQHWTEHGMTIGLGSGNLLFENVIWGGRSAGHCWNGSSQSTLTDTACFTNADCASEPGNANVCRVDDCVCRRHNSTDPPYCGTCDPEPGAPEDYCWRGSRTLDLYEVNDLVVRNNSFVGHGYMPISAIYRNFTSQNAYATCTTYPGVCEDNLTISCTQAQGDAYCGSRGAGRCIPICEVNDYKFYNNLVYDMNTQQYIKDPTYLRVPTENEWNRHTNIRIDGNLYSGGQKAWAGCQGNAQEIIRAARFGPNDQGRCWTGTMSSFTGESCTTNAQCSTGLCNNRQWQGSDCYGNPVDLTGYWYPDIESSFTDYRREIYTPASASAVMVDAGINGTDPDGVVRCATEDFNGNPRTDGQCDIGAFEFGESDPDDPPVEDPPPPVTNLDRSDKQN